MSCNGKGHINWSHNTAGWEKWNVTAVGNGNYTISSAAHFGKYLGGSSFAGSGATYFTIPSSGNGQYGLRTSAGYLSAKGNGSLGASNNFSEERFTLTKC
jgi:hypothetical protein